MKRNAIYSIGAVVALAAGSVAIAGGPGKLFPEFSKPSKGTPQMPAAEAGVKPTADSPWSTTTMASSIMGKPLKGTPVTKTGEIIDLSCYLQVGKHGDKHKDCGTKCVKNGQPVGLLEQDGTVYMLMDEEHDPRRDGLTTFRQWAADNMANVVRVNGTQTTVNGHKAVYVQGYVKQ
jgi:hypothetical protein